MSEREMMERIRRSLRERAEALPPAPPRRHGLNRRTFLLGSTAAGLAITGSVSGRQTGTPGASPVTDPALSENLFSLGIASGEPLPDGVVLWTRLAPLPFEDDGGMGPNPVDVQWEVASDERMTKIVQQGTSTAAPDWAHSVHVEVSGLEPARWYWYRFRTGDVESPIGRTRTAPAASATVDTFRFAYASCQKWDAGFYTAYRDLVQQDVDLVVHLGDYIYESTMNSRNVPREGEFDPSAFSPLRSLADYRGRYALTKLDPDLQEAHRVAPWIVTWDDHEVKNNYFGLIEPAAEELLERRAAAYKAYYEHQPLRSSARPVGPELQLYRRLAFGTLLNFNVLDTRQYRSPQGFVCGDDIREENDGFCPPSLDPGRTMLGDAQKQWLFEGFDQATTRWNVLAQQVPFARRDFAASPAEESYGGSQMDKWDGYAYEREQVVAAMSSAASQQSFSPVVITGDVHDNEVWDLKLDWDDPSPESVFGSEFVVTSLTTNGDEPLEDDGAFTTMCGNWRGNPHNRLFDNHRGYVLCEVTPDQWHADYRVMPTVLDPEATATTLTSFVVEHGNPGAQQDAGCAESGG